MTMELTIERGVLLSGLQRVQGIVEKRNTMPILSNLLMEAEEGKLRLFATDLEIGLKGEYPATVKKAGAVSISARKFLDIIRELPETQIEISSQDNHWIEITAASSKFRMAGLSPEEFPPIPNPEKEVLLTVPRKPFLEGIEKVVFAVGDNDARHILNGVLLNIKQEGRGGYTLRLVGTDGHRLAKVERKLTLEGGNTTGPPEHNLVISKKAILEIKKLLEEDDQEPVMGLSENQIVLKKGNLLFITRLMEGSFPNYEQVIPRNNKNKMALEKKTLEGALKRVSIFAREKTNAIRLTVQPNRLGLLSNNPDVGEAQEEVKAEYKGEEIVAGFNARYLLDAISVIKSETVFLHFDDAFSPCMVTDETDSQFLCVVMPMRI
jgi:DNA polymerase-3 subunit beta